jgi:hypothetical protein
VCQGEQVPGKRNQGDRDGESVNAAAEKLYGLPPDRFVAARTELVKQAKAVKDADGAGAIGKLAKPTAVAWLANQLVRADRDEVTALLDLGAELRDATAALDAARLRELTAQQRGMIAGLVRRAKELGSSAGQPVSESTARGLEDTLHAALVDGQAAADLVAGRLTTALESSGFPGMALTAAATSARNSARKTAGSSPRRPSAPAGRAAPPAGRPAERELQRAEDELAAAQDDQRVTAAERAAAQQAADDAAAAADSAAADVERLSTELDEARQVQRTVDKAHRQAVRALADAERAERQASARADRAAARRADLGAKDRR